MKPTLNILFPPDSRGGCELFGAANVPLSDIAYDSRRVTEGSFFFALPGLHTDGLRFVSSALAKGAKAVAVQGDVPADIRRAVEDAGAGLCVISGGEAKEDDAVAIRALMAEASKRFYGNPAAELALFGVTGTDGKSTTVEFLHQLISAAGITCGFWSTVRFFDGANFHSNEFRQSTPESADLHKAMRAMREAGCTHAVLEVTSHALSPKTQRVYGIEFDAAVLTNIDSEHLEFHGTVEQYARDKSRLFSRIKNGGVGIVRSYEPYRALFESAAKESCDAAAGPPKKLGQKSVRIKTYGVHSGEASLSSKTSFTAEADYFLENARSDMQGISGTLRAQTQVQTQTGQQTAPFFLPCVGLYNAENALAAIAAACEMGVLSLAQAAAAAAHFSTPLGRMNVMERGGIQGIVDYAHTPGSFRIIFPMLKASTRGRLIAVFGSAGERDTHKRAEQGAIAAAYADIIILADEDPRGEDSISILRDIASGAAGVSRPEGHPDGNSEDRQLYLISDRREAIQKACLLAREGDCVVCLGKGHEKTISYKTGDIPWDEAAVLRECLEAAHKNVGAALGAASHSASDSNAGSNFGPNSN